jgi:predicted amidophosphoribosyltransferase
MKIAVGDKIGACDNCMEFWVWSKYGYLNFCPKCGHQLKEVEE